MLHHAAVQGAPGRAACGWHERVKRDWVLGEVGRKLLPMGWAGRTAYVARSRWEPCLADERLGHARGFQISSAGIALQPLLSLRISAQWMLWTHCTWATKPPPPR